jgi:CheY-like chemotaxis protein
MLESVFDLFVQAKHTLDHADGGLGVGLTLVRALVEMHGGTVQAHSNGDGHGSEFSFKLPLTSAPEHTPTQAAGAVSSLPSGITVVVVEDNADSREMLCSMLKLEGAVCHGAGDGQEALDLIERVAPDIVIMDVGLPKVDGLEVARRVRGNPRHARVRLIALTGYGLASDRQATAQAGFDHHLVKPVQPADLFKVLTLVHGPEPSPVSLPMPSARPEILH